MRWTSECHVQESIRHRRPVLSASCHAAATCQYMFRRTSSFTSDLDAWNVAKVMNMKQMFLGARSFTSDLEDWDVAKVTDMQVMA